MSSLRVPHETEPVAALWSAWPHHADWGDALGAARGETAALMAACADAGAPARLLARTEDSDDVADVLGDRVAIDQLIFGDTWLRDTGPVWAIDADGPVAVRFRFNGWGGKYIYPGDAHVAPGLAGVMDAPLREADLVAEGGGLEHDGQGTLITTRQNLLNRNRNPGLAAADVERTLAHALGAERVIWLDEGLVNDHTDGHVDNLVRFARPGLVVCQAPAGPDDPNAAVLDQIARVLDRAVDAQGRRFDVARVASPGFVADRDGRPLPASHMNFVFAGDAVLVPTYGAPTTERAVAALQDLFPDCKVAGLSGRGLLAEGGAFHCVTNAAPGPEVSL